MKTKEEITDMLKQYCYENFGETKEPILSDIHASYNDEGIYDYGIIIDTYKKEKFGYEYDNFIAYVMLFYSKGSYPEYGYALYFWRYTYDWIVIKEHPTKSDINIALSNFITDATKHLLKERPLSMITFGDGNVTYVLLEYNDYYTVVEGTGS